MIVTALIFLGTFVILPAGLSFAVDGDNGSSVSKEDPVEPVVEDAIVEQPVPEPEPVLVARLKATKKTVVTIVPECTDDGSETRLRAASLDYLGKVSGLPDETVFEVQDCGDAGMVDIQIVETVEEIK
jgi:hypothetical protein